MGVYHTYLIHIILVSGGVFSFLLALLLLLSLLVRRVLYYPPWILYLTDFPPWPQQVFNYHFSRFLSHWCSLIYCSRSSSWCESHRMLVLNSNWSPCCVWHFSLYITIENVDPPVRFRRDDGNCSWRQVLSEPRCTNHQEPYAVERLEEATRQGYRWDSHRKHFVNEVFLVENRWSIVKLEDPILIILQCEGVCKSVTTWTRARSGTSWGIRVKNATKGALSVPLIFMKKFAPGTQVS